jgi:hypothetical protein
MSNYDELVQRPRGGCDANTAFLHCYEAADATVQLRARVAELETAGYAYRDQMRVELKRAERAESDLAAARADAERYRWLRGDVQDDFSTRWSRWRIEHWASPGPTWSDIRGADLDAAIDAAIAEEKK